MSIIPEFLLKRIYCKGSLRETSEGIAFELKNILGSGAISGINFIKINDNIYVSEAIKVITSGMTTLANQISPDNPIRFRLNQESTLLLDGAKGLKDGVNKIILEIINPEAGKIQVTLTDTI